jgi:hypothetical protein
MSDRKYRQRGYQDDDRDRPKRSPNGPAGQRPEREPGAPAGAQRISSEGARNPRMMGYREVSRCARCGTFVDAQIFSKSTCSKCGQALRACAQCLHFDSSARWECTQTIPARISPKDAANECPHFEPRTSWERETTTTVSQNPTEPSGARKAFDDLFKF